MRKKISSNHVALQRRRLLVLALSICTAIGASFLFSLAHAANPGGGTISPAGPTLNWVGNWQCHRNRIACDRSGHDIRIDSDTVTWARGAAQHHAAGGDTSNFGCCRVERQCANPVVVNRSVGKGGADR